MDLSSNIAHRLVGVGDVVMKRNLGDELVKSLKQFQRKLASGEPIEATRVDRRTGEQTKVTLHPRTPIQLQRGGRAAKIAPAVPKKRKRLSAAEKRTLEGRFATHLRALLDKRGWQVADFQDALSKQGLEVAKPGIHHWLRGQAMPKARDLEAIGRALGLPDYRDVLPPAE